MTQSTELTYLFDPLCGWCYGASARIRELANHPSIHVQPMATGLFAGPGARPMRSFAAQAWAMDQRIGALSGQTFSEDYRRKVLGDETALLDSTVATRAVAAVSEIAPERALDALATVQAARYADGKDITSPAVVAELLKEMGLAEAGARVLAADDALLRRVEDTTIAARKLMSAFGLQGVPALIATVDGKQSVLGSGPINRLAPPLVA